jgi:hypothetical protein
MDGLGRCSIDVSDCRANVGVKQWWQAFQQSHGQHWLVRLLTDRLAAAVDSPELDATAGLPQLLRFCLRMQHHGHSSASGEPSSVHVDGPLRQQLHDLAGIQVECSRFIP